MLLRPGVDKRTADGWGRGMYVVGLGEPVSSKAHVQISKASTRVSESTCGLLMGPTGVITAMATVGVAN